ncbi:MATE family efflux transporter [Roseibium polysiphoniae]|uniref:MATE family efflux transporter n=1 Tax=Roseibium polysiphoniae TaxID=2571221 RepID=A0A944CEH7_9HYPH|nr:MATE family efflux transporter [Roseibium polysiphoniae]MBS8261184.1 MATE family efflux transporter [Roseibium polysiphoniae]
MTQASHSAEQTFSVTHRSVLAIAIPMTFAYLSTPILGVVDTAVIGRLGDAALVGGIAIGGVIFDLVFTTFNFLRSGTTGLTAQAMGAGNNSEIKATFLRALVIALVAGLAVILLQAPFLDLGLSFLGGSSEVQSATRRYFEIRIYSAPFLLANYAILGWFLGLGRAGTGLMLQLVLNGLNIGLSIFFVMGLGWSIEGVALATVLSEIAATLFGLILILRAVRGTSWPALADVFDRRLFLRMLAVNRDIMIRSFSLLFAFAFFTARSADQGDVMLASNAILEKFFIVGGYFLDGLATAAEQLVGRAIGARHRPAFDRTIRLTTVWSFVLAALLAIFYFIAGPALFDLMTISPDVREIGRIYLPWAALTPLLAVLAFQMDGVFIGATWSKDMRNMMLLSLAIYIAAFYALFPLLENHGLWLSLEIFLGLRGISLAFICRRRADETFAAARP